MRHLGDHDYPGIVEVLRKHRAEWGDQVRIGPPAAREGKELIGVYLDNASQPITEQ